MTSEKQACYVYITLPGQITPVTAGYFSIEKNQYGILLGRFYYGKKYLQNPDAVAIDPINLKLTANIYETTSLKGVFGAIRDASPDYWGRRIIERYSGKASLNEIDYLLFSPDDRIGALGFGLNQKPPSPHWKFNKTIDIEKLQEIADAIVHDEQEISNSINTQLKELMLIGTSMGGARPKAVIEDKEGLWIAKFNRFDDKYNQARVEHAMLMLAKQCGLTVAESKVIHIGGKDVLLVKRFDRHKTVKGYLRSRMISALTLLGAEDTHQSRDKWSYVAFAEVLRKISDAPEKDASELFQRMCFNALISNVDDHPRNHAIIAKDKSWRLSPAYDLTPFSLISLEHRDLAMICGDQGRYANAENLLSQHARFLLDKKQAIKLLDDMERKIKKDWYAIARKEGVSEQDCESISSAFVYQGFRFNLK